MLNSTETILLDLGLEWVIYYITHIHGYLSLIVCIIGTIGNILNIMVFTRKRMISPINIILASLAIVDLVLLLAHYCTTWYLYLKPGANPYNNWFNSSQIALIMLWQHHTTCISISASVSLTVLASIWINKTINNPLRNRIWCNTKTAYKSISFIFILCVLLYLPAIIFASAIYPITDYEKNMTYYMFSINMSPPLSDILFNVDYFIYIFILRLIPAILIAVYSAKLISTFSKMKEDREKLGAEANTNHITLKSEKSIARTTLTLIILSVLCFITQLPEYIRILICCINPSAIIDYEHIIKEIESIMILINSAFTFFIYYFTSIPFWENFNALFGIKISTFSE